ncbi:uncharacterized protein TRIREDRAFT_112680 [Trichoderma reesei QM6a]|uniref:Predicted protein n=1 Tax=Hypocrea jecorina (strain QM6a) TaxID=431241 RepID=G0RXP5_HYPJQ|nr:uncharacterized protein TRIREDRAFT_112680 [Trichoderma reesei QM6a]EGR44045.1 predicted protein [Trichoderma reesei QM6a]
MSLYTVFIRLYNKARAIKLISIKLIVEGIKLKYKPSFFKTFIYCYIRTSFSSAVKGFMF